MPNRIQYSGSQKRLSFFDGNRLLVGSGWGAEICVWTVDKEAISQVFYGPDFSMTLAVSPNNCLLATGGQDKEGNGTVDIWDVSRLLR